MASRLTPGTITASFRNNLDGVIGLLTFDESLCSIVISSLEGLKKSASQLVYKQKINNLISSFQNIHEAKSLKPKFDAINNQCVVLLVSYFGSTLQELFLCYLRERLFSDMQYHMDEKELKVKIHELRKMLKEEGNELLPELVLENEAISFQDMKSITENFKKYFGIELKRDCDMENILFAQAARHVIVHNGCIVDNKMVRQLKHADLRRIKQSIKGAETIFFTPDEVKLIADSMGRFIQTLTSTADKVLGKIS